jgi:3-oxoacyl-[acyl-carrier protein] reductase
VDLGIRGKVALVAASSKGLGRAIAEELAAEGADLVRAAPMHCERPLTRSAGRAV